MQFQWFIYLFLGNDNIFALTNQKLYSARFDMKDVEQKRRYALYDKFWIDDESNKYTLHISDYSGDASNVKDWVFYFFRIFNFFYCNYRINSCVSVTFYFESYRSENTSVLWTRIISDNCMNSYMLLLTHWVPSLFCLSVWAAK